MMSDGMFNQNIAVNINLAFSIVLDSVFAVANAETILVFNLLFPEMSV